VITGQNVVSKHWGLVRVGSILAGLVTTALVVLPAASASAAPTAGMPTATASAPTPAGAELPAGLASAAATVWCTLTADRGAEACFNPTGEHLQVCDTASDGHHPGVTYSINGGAAHNAQFNLGNGHCHDINLDIAETGNITFLAINYEGSTVQSVSPVITVSARG
jgi:hypothetical protein